MTVAARVTRGASVIAVAVASDTNARLLERVLGDRYRLHFSLENNPGQPADLIIVDASSLQRH